MKGALREAVVLLVTTMAVVRAPGQGQTADQLHDLASQAKSSDDLQREADYLCQAAVLDGKKYQKKCDHAREVVERTLSQFQVDLQMARNEIQHGDYAGAARDLQKITFGPNKDEAQRLIVRARKGMNGEPPEEQDSLQALQAARAAYFRGDLDTAESLVKQVQSPGLQPAVTQLLTNISIYRDTMAQAEALEHNGDYSGAEQKYQFAAIILADGPGNPRQRLQAVQAAEAAAKAKAAQEATAQQAVQVSPPTIDKSHGATKTPSSAKVTGPIKAAHQTEAGGHANGALQSYSAALKLDPHHADALADKARVPAAMQSEPETMEPELESGVAGFYASHLDEANEAFRGYLQAGGKQYAGAAHFYLGASLLTQAILASPGDQTKVLREEAQQEFELARQLHYRPIEPAVSPKIIAQWTQTGGQH